jgi:hypothetical protein
MSSVVVWRDEASGVTASWNKDGPYTVFVPLLIDQQGICDGRTSEWPSEVAAIEESRRAAEERLEQMRVEDPSKKRFQLVGERGAAPAELHDRKSLEAVTRFGTLTLQQIDALPVSGTCRAMLDGRTVVVQRVQ